MAKNEKQTMKFIVADKDNSPDAAVRFFNTEGKQVYYASTRLETLKRVEAGYLVENVGEYTGMNYVLKKIESGQVLKGIVKHHDPVENEKELTSFSIPQVTPIKGNEIK